MLHTNCLYVKPLGGPGDAMETTSLDQTAAFVRCFADGWRIGATQPERFFEHFGRRLTPDAVLSQPLSPVLRGPQGLRALFGPLFRIVPDLRGEVVRWGATEDGLLVELALRGTLAGRAVAWTAVDRIVLRGGLIAARRSYFDPLPLIEALLSRPRAAVTLLRLLLRGRDAGAAAIARSRSRPVSGGRRRRGQADGPEASASGASGATLVTRQETESALRRRARRRP
jgi:ketosteroid isomerase-like protein